MKTGLLILAACLSGILSLLWDPALEPVSLYVGEVSFLDPVYRACIVQDCDDSGCRDVPTICVSYIRSAWIQAFEEPGDATCTDWSDGLRIPPGGVMLIQVRARNEGGFSP